MVQVIAHRGCSGAAPENTLAAFQLAIEQKCHLIELDVQFTRDLEPVVIHDPTVDRTTSGAGSVAGMDLKEVKGLDAGSWFDPSFQGERVPSLEQVLAMVRPTQTDLLIEFKDSPLFARACRRVLEVIREYGMESRCRLQSFDPEVVRRFGRLAAEIPRAALFQTVTPNYVGEAKGLGADTLVLSRRLVGDLVVFDARRNGIQVFVWTVDEPAEIRRMIQMGVDGVISNRPERVFQALAGPPGSP